MFHTKPTPDSANLNEQQPRIPKRGGSPDVELDEAPTHRRRRLYHVISSASMRGSPPPSGSSDTKKCLDLNAMMSALEFNSIPAFTFHETPHFNDIPSVVRELSKLLSSASSGCGSIPELLTAIEIHPRFITEHIPDYIWRIGGERTPAADTKLWYRVRSIVDASSDLRRTQAADAAYVSLAQDILEGRKTVET